MPDDPLIRPSVLPPLSGTEALGDGQVLDFWRWALGDLRMNNARGYLAEFLVARAVEDPRPIRIEWGAHDVESGDGTRIEVKATGLLQSWTSRRIPRPRWSLGSIHSQVTWDDETAAGDVPTDPWDRVDVWVFALHTATDPALYDPLDLTQWEFRAVPHRALLITGQQSVGVSAVERLGVVAVGLGDLAEAEPVGLVSIVDRFGTGCWPLGGTARFRVSGRTAREHVLLSLTGEPGSQTPPTRDDFARSQVCGTREVGLDGRA